MKNYICNCEEGYILPIGEICPFCFVPKKKKPNRKVQKMLLKENRDMQILMKYITGKNMAKIARELGISRKTVKAVIFKHKKGNEITNN